MEDTENQERQARTLEPPPDVVFELQLVGRVGLVSKCDGEEFSLQSKQELAESERELQRLRRQVQLQTARCEGQLDVVAKEARAEEEIRIISEKVGRELAGFREEQRRKDAAEDERLRHLYRAMLMPVDSLSELEGIPPFTLERSGAARDYCANRGDGVMGFPHLICSKVHILEDDPMSSSASSWRTSMPQAPSKPVRAGERPRRKSRQVLPPIRPPDNASTCCEADNLLRINLARLQKLERLGV